MRRNLPDPSLSLAELLPSWQLALQAERKSPGTIKSYTEGVTVFLRWCEATGTPPQLDRSAVQAFVAHLLENGAEPTTARARQLGVRRFARWLVDEGEYDSDPLLGIKQPKLDRKVVDALTDDQLRRLIKACQGKSLRDRRDEALIRLMAETGMRAGEVIGMQLSDIDLQRGLATVRRGTGGKGRIAPFSPQTATAIDRYVRMRRTHRLAEAGPLWVGGGGKTFSYAGLNRSLRERAEAAGISPWYPHLLRHTAATRWLRAGGSEQGLMAVAGWSTRSMIDRYTGASAAESAAAEARNLGLGDL
jgi:site-specific recombinase XerD